MKLNVLMSSYNGEKYIAEQVDSILAQKTDFQVVLTVRDDGSKDRTREILQNYADIGKLKWYNGENLRSAKSFWNLLRNCEDADYYAFCDQDDFWFEDKLQKAVKKLSEEDRSKPLLYCGSVIVADQHLCALPMEVSDIHYTDFAHSLIYSLAPGCTFVFNDAARKELLKYDADKYRIYMHDWLAHQIIAMRGKVIFDTEALMLYRQHGNNVVGAQKKGLGKYIEKVKRFFATKDPVRSNMAAAILEQYRDGNDPCVNEILDMVANYKSNHELKKKFKKDVRFKSEGLNGFALKILIAMNKI